MTITLMRVCFSLLAVAFLMSTVACVGPQGPPGPAGPGGGPPYVWICTPAHFALVANNLVAGNTVADLYVFNEGSTSANIAVHILDKDGANLAGLPIPGGGGPSAVYPGQTGNTTQALLPAHTLILQWLLPNIPQNQFGSAINQLANVSTSIRVVSDQPIAVSSNFQLNGVHPIPCSLLPK